MIMYIPGDTATNMNAHKYALNIVCGIHLKSRAQTGYILIIMACHWDIIAQLRYYRSNILSEKKLQQIK